MTLPHLPRHTTYGEVGQPISTDVNALLADGIQVFALVLDDGTPALGFVFTAAGQTTPPIVLTHLDGLRELVGQALDSAHKHDGYTGPPGHADPATVRCPGCSRRLFGERAAAGVCGDCAQPQTDRDGEAA